MSRAITVCHGDFGRLCFLELNRVKVMHAHREGQVTFLIDGDDSTCIVDDDPVTLSIDRAVSINSFSPHEVHVPKGKSGATLLSLYINPLWFATHFPSNDPEWLNFGTRSFPVTNEVRQQLEHLLALVQPPAPDKQAGYHEVLNSRIQQLCRECFDFSNREERSFRLDNPLIACDARIRKSLAIMNEHVRKVLPLDEIAHTAGLSRPHFYRLFRENLGVTPNVYMNLLRMDFALDRLIFSDQPVTSIALDLGFASQASFTRFFGANVGLPPTDYRRVARVAPSVMALGKQRDEVDLSSGTVQSA